MLKDLFLPRLGSLRARARVAACVSVASLTLCFASPRMAKAIWPFTSNEAPVGSAQWWKSHNANAVFTEHMGYKVEGVDGYFDGDGRPIQGPVAPERVIEASEKKDDALIPGLDPHEQYTKIKTAVGLGPNEQIARKDYVEGDRLFREKNYKAAAEKFQAAIDRGPHSAIEQDSMFMLAESYFYGDQYIKARDAYDGLVKEHTNTRYMDKVIEHEWAIAQYWEKYEQRHPDWPATPHAWDKTRPWFDTIGHAIKTYDSIRLNDPTGPRADDAIMATANIYFARGKYDDADYHYTLLRKEYPRSELQYEAHLLGLQAKMRKYQGENYDGTPLEEAKVLVKNLNSQFGNRLSPEEKTAAGHGVGAAKPANRHPRLPHGRLLRPEERLWRCQALLRPGYPEVPGYGPESKIARSDCRNQERAGEPNEAAWVSRRSVAGKPRAYPRRPYSRIAKRWFAQQRRHAIGGGAETGHGSN